MSSPAGGFSPVRVERRVRLKDKRICENLKSQEITGLRALGVA